MICRSRSSNRFYFIQVSSSTHLSLRGRIDSNSDHFTFYFSCFIIMLSPCSFKEMF